MHYKNSTIACVLVLGMLWFLLLCLVAGGCGAGKDACAVVDVAERACAVVRYLGPDGRVHVVPVTSAEVTRFGNQVESMRAAALRDAAPE